MRHHNNLPDDQIHVPKGFDTANDRSLPIKNSSGSLEWERCNYTTVSTITCVADVGGSLHHRYFTLHDDYDGKIYAVYLNVTSVEAFTTPTGHTDVVAVDCTSTGSGSTAAQIAGYIDTDLTTEGFTTSTSGDDIIVSTVKTSSEVVDVDTGFSIVNVQTKDVSEILTTDSSGNIKWNSQSNLLSDTIEFQGYGALTTNYNLLKGFENTADGKFGTDFGSADNTDVLSPKNALRSGRFIAARDYTLNRWTGLATNTSSDVVTIELWKVTPVDNSSTNLTITVLKSTTITGAGNNDTRTFDLDLTGEANRTISKGDIVLCAVKNDDSASTFYLNSSLRLEYKI